MLHFETIAPPTLELLKKLQHIRELNHTLLVGGTALALQFGHRKSIDIDLFGNIPDLIDIPQYLDSTGKVTLLKQSKHIHSYTINSVKVDIVNYPYPWISEPIMIDGTRIAGLKDICAMKLAAITGRGSKKDFIDIYFLLQHFTLNEMLSFYSQKYVDGSTFLVLKSLAYFDDAEIDPDPSMLIKVDWDTIKQQ